MSNMERLADTRFGGCHFGGYCGDVEGKGRAGCEGGEGAGERQCRIPLTKGQAERALVRGLRSRKKQNGNAMESNEAADMARGRYIKGLSPTCFLLHPVPRTSQQDDTLTTTTTTTTTTTRRPKTKCQPMAEQTAQCSNHTWIRCPSRCSQLRCIPLVGRRTRDFGWSQWGHGELHWLQRRAHFQESTGSHAESVICADIHGRTGRRTGTVVG